MHKKDWNLHDQNESYKDPEHLIIYHTFSLLCLLYSYIIITR